MIRFFHDTVLCKTDMTGARTALVAGSQEQSYAALAERITSFAMGLAAQGIARHDRIVVFLDKRIDTVVAFYGTGRAGGIFVPCNPVLKPMQVLHIITDCEARVLISSRSRIEGLGDSLKESPIRLIISVDSLPDDLEDKLPDGARACLWSDIMASTAMMPSGPLCETDVAAIFYTSGSTGKPKGVVLSHQIGRAHV